MSAPAIVFGPTGNVAAIAARTAQRQGAKVILAMRDVRKPIPGLNVTEESEGGYVRVQADLTKPDSIFTAVKQTKATSAFMYLAHGSADHMKASLEASKAAGIKFIVFLSSFTIKGDLNKIEPTDRIPYIHARVEMNLESIYGPKDYVALRPGAFATNTLRWRTGLDSGEMRLDSPDTQYDFITPVDMGRVAGTILAGGQQDGQHIVYLYGPELVAQKHAIAVVAKALGKTVEAVPFDAQPGSDQGSTAQASAHNVLVRYGPEEKRSKWFVSAYSNHEEGVANVSKYTGTPATSYQEWVEENKLRFRL